MSVCRFLLVSVFCCAIWQRYHIFHDCQPTRPNRHRLVTLPSTSACGHRHACTNFLYAKDAAMNWAFFSVWGRCHRSIVTITIMMPTLGSWIAAVVGTHTRPEYRIDSCKGPLPTSQPKIWKENIFNGEAIAFGAPMPRVRIGEFSRAANFRAPLPDGESCAFTSAAMVHPGIWGAPKSLAAPHHF